jgi:hypothetical protein
VPPLLPTTSPVAVAAARILAAYLSNHKLSPAEAASLSGTIVETLAGLARQGRAMSNPTLRLVAEPAPARRTKALARRHVPAEVEPPAPRSGTRTGTGSGLSAEPEAETQPISEPDDGAIPSPEPSGASAPDLQAEATDVLDLPRRRKRPSRPRSRRGQGAVPMSAPEAPSNEAPPDEARSDEVPSDEDRNGEPPGIALIRAQPDIAVTRTVAAAEVAAEGAKATPKPRRPATRARRVTTP